MFGATASHPLQVLLDHSLLTREPDENPPRYFLFETLRAYLGARRGRASDGGAAVELRFARWLARLGEPAHVDLMRIEGQVGAWMEQRHYARDLVEAAERALQWDKPDIAAQCLCGAILAIAHHRPSPELFRLLDATRSHPSLLPLHAQWLDVQHSFLLMMQDQSIEAQEIAQQAAKTTEDPLVRAHSWSVMAHIRQRTGSPDAGQLFLDIADEYQTANALTRAELCKGKAKVMAGDLDGGRRNLLQAERLARAYGERLVGANASREIGRLDQARGELDLAAQRFHSSLEVFEDIDNVPAAYAVLYFLQDLYLWSGDGLGFDDVTERALIASRRRGSRTEEATSFALKCGSQIARGALPEARTSMEAARTALVHQASNEESHVAYLDWFEAELELATGQPAEAARLAAQAKRTLEQLGVPMAGVLATTEAAAHAMNDATQALALANEGLAALEANALIRYRSFAAARMGLIAVQAQQWDYAQSAWQMASDAASQAGIADPQGWAGRLLFALQQALASSGRGNLGVGPPKDYSHRE